jgi:hypothetical protein
LRLIVKWTSIDWRASHDRTAMLPVCYTRWTSTVQGRHTLRTLTWEWCFLLVHIIQFTLPFKRIFTKFITRILTNGWNIKLCNYQTSVSKQLPDTYSYRRQIFNKKVIGWFTSGRGAFTCRLPLDGYLRNWSGFVVSSHCHFAIIHPHVTHCFFKLLDLVVTETKFSLIFFNLNRHFKSTPFDTVVLLHLILYHFVFQFLHLIVLWSMLARKDTFYTSSM